MGRGDLTSIVIEASGLAEPAPIASLFDDDARDAIARGSPRGFHLDAVVDVVDAQRFLDDFASTAEVNARADWADERVDSHDRRGVVQLLVEQVEGGDIVVVNKADLVTPA